jgi:hypothetical protein
MNSMQFKRMIAERTGLPHDVSALVAFWAISTWFQEALPVIPCLVITGPAHEAMSCSARSSQEVDPSAIMVTKASVSDSLWTCRNF